MLSFTIFEKISTAWIVLIHTRLTFKAIPLENSFDYSKVSTFSNVPLLAFISQDLRLGKYRRYGLLFTKCGCGRIFSTKRDFNIFNIAETNEANVINDWSSFSYD